MTPDFLSRPTLEHQDSLAITLNANAELFLDNAAITEEALANAAEQINQFIQNNNYSEKKPD